jgi:flagellar motor switch protein FliM
LEPCAGPGGDDTLLPNGASQFGQTDALWPIWGRPQAWNSRRAAAGGLIQGETSDRLASCALFGGDFQRLFLSTVTERLGPAVQIHPAGIWQVSLGQFRTRVGEPTCCYRLIVQPGAQPGASIAAQAAVESIWLEFTPPLAQEMVNLLLGCGAPAEPLGAQKPLTAVEQGLLRQIAQLVADALAAAWPANPPPAVSLARNDATPESASHHTSEEALAVLSFFVSLSDRAGAMRLAMAPELLESLLPDKPAAVGNPKALELSASLPETTIPAEELARLAPGDILLTDTPADGETVVVRVAGIAKFAARLGCWGGRRAVSITGRLARPAASSLAAPDPF